MAKELPSISSSAGTSTPRVAHIIGEPKHLERRIRLRRTTEADEKRRLERQYKEAEVFWNLCMRNRP
jgi:hypothetical protein